jgi:hypothetical protein
MNPIGVGSMLRLSKCPENNAAILRLAALRAIRWQQHTNSMTMRTSISAGPKAPKPNMNEQSSCRWQRLGWRSLNNGKWGASQGLSPYWLLEHGLSSMSAIERLLMPSSTEQPGCHCSDKVRITSVDPALETSDARIRIYKCRSCAREMRLTVWASDSAA